MFAVIRANQQKSAALIVLMGLILAATGYAFGFLLDPSLAGVGMAITIGLWTILLAVSLGSGEAMLLKQAGARELQRAELPRLFNVVEEMQLASGLTHLPRIYLIDSPAPNAFAVGRTEQRAAVAVTTGLMARLNRDELQGVIAHELAHIRNRDTLFMTLAATTMGAIIMLADFYVRGVRYSNMRSRRTSSRNGKGTAVVALAALALAILAPLLARLLYFACSRRREYLADACAAQFTRYPEGLASALQKIAGQPAGDEPASRVLAPLYIANPQAAHGASGLFSTHPPMADRVRVLRAMAGGSSLAAYEQAYRSLHGNHGVVGANLAASQEAGLRAAQPEPEPPPLGPAWREARGALHSSDGLQVVDCACGVRLRVPPGLNQSSLLCPRCGHVHPLGGGTEGAA
jgi:heat shock protein HtpX